MMNSCVPLTVKAGEREQAHSPTIFLQPQNSRLYRKQKSVEWKQLISLDIKDAIG